MVDIFSSPNKQLSNGNPDVEFEILKYLVASCFEYLPIILYAW